METVAPPYCYEDKPIKDCKALRKYIWTIKNDLSCPDSFIPACLGTSVVETTKRRETTPWAARTQTILKPISHHMHNSQQHKSARHTLLFLHRLIAPFWAFFAWEANTLYLLHCWKENPAEQIFGQAGPILRCDAFNWHLKKSCNYGWTTRAQTLLTILESARTELLSAQLPLLPREQIRFVMPWYLTLHRFPLNDIHLK